MLAMKFKPGNQVRVKKIIGNVTDDVKQCEGQIGVIKCYGSPRESVPGYYVKFAGSLPTKRFYEDELEAI